MASYKEILERQIYNVQAKLGSFLQTGKTLYGYKDAAQNYTQTDNPAVRQAAQGVIAKTYSLLTINKSIQSQAIETLQRANEEKTKMEQDPLWASILAGQMPKLGWRSLEVARQKIGVIVSLTKDLININSKMNQHIKDVKSVKDDLDDLAKFAQGKGITARLAQIGGGFQATLNKIVVIGGIGLVAWLMFPMIVKSTVKK